MRSDFICDRLVRYKHQKAQRTGVVPSSVVLRRYEMERVIESLSRLPIGPLEYKNLTIIPLEVWKKEHLIKRAELARRKAIDDANDLFASCLHGHTNIRRGEARIRPKELVRFERYERYVTPWYIRLIRGML